METGIDSGSQLHVLIAVGTEFDGELLPSALEGAKAFRATAVRDSEFLSALTQEPIDVAVIAADLHHDSRDGFDLARSVSVAHPNVGIVVLMDKLSRAAVLHAFRAGASAVISREQPLSDFFDCITQVAKGRIWTGKEETRFLLDLLKSIPVRDPLVGTPSPLSTRERQVARSAAAGKTNSEIAGELGLSEDTVKNDLFKAFEKLGVSGRAEFLFSLASGGGVYAALQLEGEK